MPRVKPTALTGRPNCLKPDVIFIFGVIETWEDDSKYLLALREEINDIIPLRCYSYKHYIKILWTTIKCLLLLPNCNLDLASSTSSSSVKLSLEQISVNDWNLMYRSCAVWPDMVRLFFNIQPLTTLYICQKNTLFAKTNTSFAIVG